MALENEGKLNRIIFDTDSFSIRLTPEEYRQYRKEERALQDKWILLEQERRGIWASNQGRYVQYLSQLNEWDLKPRVIHPKYRNKRGD